MRDTPAPPFRRHDDGGVRTPPFDARTGKPGRSLLILLRFAGEKPALIEFADDGRLMAADGAPPMIVSLAAMWRQDRQVEALLVRTVAASRKAGRAVWPPEIAAEVRGIAPTGGGVRPPRDWTDGLGRE
ncbi:MAG TPA: hypothetical protein VGC10_03545 [Sphingomonas sp.]